MARSATAELRIGFRSVEIRGVDEYLPRPAGVRDSIPAARADVRHPVGAADPLGPQDVDDLDLTAAQQEAGFDQDDAQARARALLGEDETLAQARAWLAQQALQPSFSR